MVIILSLGILVMATAVWVLSGDRIRLKREHHIRAYVFPTPVFERLRKLHPHLTTKECQLVARALRQFFLAHLNSGRAHVGMPSRVTDDLWHEFILHTQAYGRFCRDAFGRPLHHTPAGSVGMGSKEDEGVRRTWRYTCREENIDPNRPTRLPLLFALDEKLKIDGGVRYTLGQFERKGRSTTANGCSGGDMASCHDSSRSAFACIGGGLISAGAADSCSDGGAVCGGGCGGCGGD